MWNEGIVINLLFLISALNTIQNIYNYFYFKKILDTETPLYKQMCLLSITGISFILINGLHFPDLIGSKFHL